MAGVDAYFVAATTKHPEAVREFLAGFLDDDTATSFMIDTKNISAVKGIVQRVASRGEATTRGVLALADELGRARHSYQWWDWLLPPKVAEEMLSLSQSLSLGEVSPVEFAKRLDKAAGR
jgi:ABC-type glycerol-3-phosphate transport system substrate-binding protein